jgi:hypothetical protein
MQCPNCDTTNAEGSRFCMGCGRDLQKILLAIPCANCGATNVEGSKFCMSCGLPLPETILSPTAQTTMLKQPRAIVKQANPMRSHRAPALFFDGVDLLLALVGTALGVLATWISRYLIARVSYPVPAFAQTIGITLLTVLVAFVGIVLVAFGVFKTRAMQKNMQQKRLVQREKAFFRGIEEDISGLLGTEGKQYAK